MLLMLYQIFVSLFNNNYYYKYPNHKVAIENLPDLIGIRVECRFIDDEKKIFDEKREKEVIQKEGLRNLE